MSNKTKKIIDWVLAGIVGLLFIASAAGKLAGSQQTIDMAQQLGISAATFKTLGVIELLSAVLFIIPRTGVLGTLLLAAYMGGAIATHLQHGLPLSPVIIIEALVWIVAVVRFPELRQRLIP